MDQDGCGPPSRRVPRCARPGDADGRPPRPSAGGVPHRRSHPCPAGRLVGGSAGRQAGYHRETRSPNAPPRGPCRAAPLDTTPWVAKSVRNNWLCPTGGSRWCAHRRPDDPAEAGVTRLVPASRNGHDDAGVRGARPPSGSLRPGCGRWAAEAVSAGRNHAARQRSLFAKPRPAQQQTRRVIGLPLFPRSWSTGPSTSAWAAGNGSGRNTADSGIGCGYATRDCGRATAAPRGCSPRTRSVRWSPGAWTGAAARMARGRTTRRRNTPSTAP